MDNFPRKSICLLPEAAVEEEEAGEVEEPTQGQALQAHQGLRQLRGATHPSPKTSSRMMNVTTPINVASVKRILGLIGHFRHRLHRTSNTTRQPHEERF